MESRMEKWRGKKRHMRWGRGWKNGEVKRDT